MTMIEPTMTAVPCKHCGKPIYYQGAPVRQWTRGNWRDGWKCAASPIGEHEPTQFPDDLKTR